MVPGIKATHKGKGNGRVLVTKKDKDLYKDDYYLERKISHREALRVYDAFCREHSHPQSYPSSWAGIVT